MKIRGNYVFLRNADAKSSSKNAEHICIFCEKATILGALGALGQVWRRDWNRGAKREHFYQKDRPWLEVILATFVHFRECMFECIFRCPHFAHFGRFGSPKVPKREVWGGHGDAILGIGSTCEN